MTLEDIEVLSNLIEEAGIVATEEQVKSIGEDYGMHLEMQHESSMIQFVGGSKECESCKGYLKRIGQLEDIVEVYSDSVKKRRNTDKVWVEDGQVKYI